MRERIDVSEIEAKTKIRARYLRALENEEWDLLPGPTFVRSFLRTYAQALGLDGRALVEEYRMRFEPPSDIDHQPAVPSPRKLRPSRYTAGAASWGGSSRGYLFAVGAVGVVILLLVIGLLAGGKGSSPTKARAVKGSASARSPHARVSPPSVRTVSRAALSLQPSAPVYVCLIGDGHRKLIPGLIIEPPYKPVTFHATRFEITLGNNAVTLYVDGRPSSVPESSQAIGYSITSSGLRTLAAAQLPTCK